MERKDAEREEARRLRAEGMSIGRIASTVGVSKSSVSVWVRDVETPPRPPRGRPRRPRFVEPIEALDPSDLDPDQPAKYCQSCDRTLPLTAFNRLRDGHQHWCRECFSIYFKERGAKHREQSGASRAQRREAARAFLRNHLDAHPCADCGETEVFVLEFDHVAEKTSSVALLLAGAAKLSKLRDEVAKCQVVCVNCHRRRTATRAGYFRATGVPPASWNAAQRRNNELLVETLRRSGCIDCGERDAVVLDFDHRSDKRGMVTKLAMGCSTETLHIEIQKCDVRCANCHRLRTLASGRCWRGDADHWAIALFADADP